MASPLYLNYHCPFVQCAWIVWIVTVKKTTPQKESNKLPRMRVLLGNQGYQASDLYQQPILKNREAHLAIYDLIVVIVLCFFPIFLIYVLAVDIVPPPLLEAAASQASRTLKRSAATTTNSGKLIS